MTGLVSAGLTTNWRGWAERQASIAGKAGIAQTAGIAALDKNWEVKHVTPIRRLSLPTGRKRKPHTSLFDLNNSNEKRRTNYK